MLEINVSDIIEYYDENIHAKLDQKSRELECSAKEVLNIKLDCGHIKETIYLVSMKGFVSIDLNKSKSVVNIELV